jgi:hypothetical protein
LVVQEAMGAAGLAVQGVLAAATAPVVMVEADSAGRAAVA